MFVILDMPAQWGAEIGELPNLMPGMAAAKGSTARRIL
jgi:hypothetical protein